MVRVRTFPFDFLALASLIFTFAWFLGTRIPSLPDPGLLASALTLDITILVPGLYYWLAVRRRGWPAFSTLGVFVFCALVASRLVPKEHQELLGTLTLIIPVLETALFATILWMVVGLTRRARGQVDLLQVSLDSVTRFGVEGRARAIASFEFALLLYAFGFGKASSGEGTFSNHRRTALSAITGALLLAIAAESVPAHLLLIRWSPVAAWIHLALALYSALWLLGDLRALKLRPLEISSHGLRLRLGLRWQMDVPWSEVELLEGFAGPVPTEKEILQMVPMGTIPSHRLRLREPRTARGLYGITRQVREILFFVDDRTAFDSYLQTMAPAIPSSGAPGKPRPSNVGV